MKITRYNGDFVKCLAQIPQGDVVVTARDGIQDRIKLSKLKEGSHYFQNGGWHPEGTARINGINYWCLRDFAPTMLYPQETLDANKQGNYLALAGNIKIGNKPALEVIPAIASEDEKKLPENKRVLAPKNQGEFSVDSTTLGDVDIARFLARSPKLAQKYGEMLNNVYGISKVTFYQLSADNVAAGFWLHRLGRLNASEFYGISRLFDIANGSLFGGTSSSASASQGASHSALTNILSQQQRANDEQSVPKNLRYSPKEAQQALRDFNYLLSGKAKLEELKTDSPRARRVLSLLEKLGQ